MVDPVDGVRYKMQAFGMSGESFLFIPDPLADTVANSGAIVAPHTFAHALADHAPDSLADTVANTGAIVTPHAAAHALADPVANALADLPSDLAADQLADARSLSRYFVLTGLRWCTVGR